MAAELRRIYPSRQARTWAGGAGIVGFLALIVEILAGARFSSYFLLGSWAAVGLVYLVVRLISRRLVAGWTRAHTALTDDVFADLNRIDGGGAEARLVQRTHRIELHSFILPLATVTLLTPLTIHFLVGTIFLCVPFYKFNGWILISLLLVGHAHLTLLILSTMHVLRVRRELDRGVPVNGISRGFWALLWTITSSTIPGAVLLCIPPILVALTGLVFIPWMFQWVTGRARVERAILEAHGLPGPLPDLLRRG